MTDIPTPEDKPTLEQLQKDAIIKPNILDGLPEYVKHPKNYMKIQKALLETLSCGKSHGDPSEMIHCKKCAVNMVERRRLMKRFGFTSSAQYMAWRKTHEEIKKHMPLDKYNSLIQHE